VLKAQFPVKGVGLFFIFFSIHCLAPSAAYSQFWKNWFKKKPEERGVLGGKESLQERIKSRTLDDGEDARPLVFIDSAASDKRVVRKKRVPKRMFFGVMTKKAFIRNAKGRKVTLETFYYIKKGLNLLRPFFMRMSVGRNQVCAGISVVRFQVQWVLLLHLWNQMKGYSLY